jgi:hypothetical protein
LIAGLVAEAFGLLVIGANWEMDRHGVLGFVAASPQPV